MSRQHTLARDTTRPALSYAYGSVLLQACRGGATGGACAIGSGLAQAGAPSAPLLRLDPVAAASAAAAKSAAASVAAAGSPSATRAALAGAAVAGTLATDRRRRGRAAARCRPPAHTRGTKQLDSVAPPEAAPLCELGRWAWLGKAHTATRARLKLAW